MAKPPLLPSINTCRAARPDPLPSVEPDLRAPPPRRIDWACDEHGRRLQPNVLDLLRDREAVKGWVVAVHTTHAREDIDYHVDLAFERAGRILVRRIIHGFDPLHWHGPHATWWADTILPGCTVTLLLGRAGELGIGGAVIDDGGEPVLFGQFEVFRRRPAGPPVWAADDGAATGLVPAVRRMELLLAAPTRTFDDLRAINNAVVAMNIAKKWDLAAELADLALPEAPHNPAIYWACACAYAQTGRLDDALAAVRAAIAADYEDLADLRRDRDLAPLKQLPQWRALWRRR